MSNKATAGNYVHVFNTLKKKKKKSVSFTAVVFESLHMSGHLLYGTKRMSLAYQLC